MCWMASATRLRPCVRKWPNVWSYRRFLIVGVEGRRLYFDEAVDVSSQLIEEFNKTYP